MTDSDSDLKTDEDASPPPQRKTRNSMDETEEQTEEQKIAQLQAQPQSSASPRPPPTEPPPPVPPKPTQNNHNTLHNLDANPAKKIQNSAIATATNYRARMRKRRASLPSINMLPSFGSLKRVMGFGVDEEDSNTKKESETERKHKENDAKIKEKLIRKENEQSQSQSQKQNNSREKPKTKTLNKKLNPKEIKQLYIKNLKLQAQIDKYKAREKEVSDKLQDYQYKLTESSELCEELRNQVGAKSEVVRSLDEQLQEKKRRVREFDALQQQWSGRLQEMERVIVEKDTLIEKMKVESNQSLNVMGRGRSVDKSGGLSPSPDPRNGADNTHNRSLTPGGYELDAMHWGMANEVKTETDNSHPSAPPMEDEFADTKVHGLSLDQKLKQRSSWVELHSRGILLADPTTKKSNSLQAAHRSLHKRKASQNLDKMLVNRPDRQQLQQNNILRNPLGDGSDEQKQDSGLQLGQKIAQRSAWQDLNSRGILLDDPSTNQSQSLQAAQRKLHKRKASQNLDKMLMNRPTPENLHQQNIIDARTAALFFGASPATEVVTPRVDYLGDDAYGNIMSATDSLIAASQPSDSERKTNVRDHIIYKDNADKTQISAKLERNLRQRPSIHETVSRGILMFRPDTRLNHDLQTRHKQLHKRKASQSIEKLMKNRPKHKQLQQKGILIENESEQRKHKRKASQDLEAGLKKRKSLSELQGLGLLFSDTGFEFETHSSDETEHFMNDDEQNKNIASLFQQKPRTSKPLHETDFKGMEFDEYAQNKHANKRRGSVDNTFEPFKLTKKQRISRIGDKLAQRPSVDDMKMRGLLYEHPSISKSLVERKRDLMKRRASTKVENLLQNRPRRHELENKNILLQEDETLEKRRRHKRKASQNLENAIKRRPKLMEEQEAKRQRKRSMTDSDFTPDYFQHIFNDEEDEEYKNDLNQIEIRFLNIGGFVIPLVSQFMSEMHAMDNGHMNAIEHGNGENQQEMEALQSQMEELTEDMEDLQMDIDQQQMIIKQKDTQILKLKTENSSLKQKFSRKSGNEEELDRVKRENEVSKEYIERLGYYLKEEKNIIIPTAKQLKKKKGIKNKLKNHFKQRPSFMDLQNKQILSSNFHNDVTNQNAQIAERKLKFKRRSQMISNFLSERPSKDSIVQYFKDSLDYNEYLAQTKESDENIRYIDANVDIVDNATKDEMREEVVRLNNKLAEKININGKLTKENETMRFKLQQNLNQISTSLGSRLKEHSIYENKILDATLSELQKDSEESQMINELKGENENLKQKIRRLSTVDSNNPLHKSDFNNHSSADTINEMKEFVNWSRTLQWPNIIVSIYNNHSLSDFVLMKQVMNGIQSIERDLQFEISELKKDRQRIGILEQKLDRQRQEHFEDKQRFVASTMKEFDRMREQIKNVGRATQIIANQQLQAQTQNGTLSSYVSSYFWNKK